MTGETILSMYRRPILSANLRFKDQNDNPGVSGDTNVMWDGREQSLRTQAVDATLGHAQALYPPTEAQVDQIVDFETKFFTAQIVDKQAGRLDLYGATGGPVHLSGRSTDLPTGFPPPPAFDEYVSWANLTGSPKADEQASIERGQAIFLNKPLTVANVGGFNDLIPPAPGFNPVTALPGQLPDLPRHAARGQRDRLPAAARHRRRRSGTASFAGAAGRARVRLGPGAGATTCRCSSSTARPTPIRSMGRRSSPTTPARG